MLAGLLTLLIFLVSGEFLNSYFSLPIPGSIIGMLFLLISLLILKRTPASLKQIADKLSPLLPLFIIPISVGLITQKPLIAEHGLTLLLIMFVSLIPGIIVTAWVISFKNPANSSKPKE